MACASTHYVMRLSADLGLLVIQRSGIPPSITSGAETLNISDWGNPTAAYPTGPSCNTSEYFTAQQLIFDITLCGDWCVSSAAFCWVSHVLMDCQLIHRAGVPSIYAGTGCANAGPTGDCVSLYARLYWPA